MIKKNRFLPPPQLFSNPSRAATARLVGGFFALALDEQKGRQAQKAQSYVLGELRRETAARTRGAKRGGTSAKPK